MPQRAAPPADNPWNAAHAQGLRDRQLLLQHCADCGFVRLPPGPICPCCWSERFRWAPHAGTGQVTSCIWYHRPLHPRFPQVPYNVALVQLDGAAPVLVSSVMDTRPGSLRVGDRVRACYSDEGPGNTVLLFTKDPAGDDA